MSRTWVYSTMVDDATLTALIPGGVHASTAVTKTPTSKPFIMYRVLSDRPELRGDDAAQVDELHYQLFVHDVPGDYLIIDTIVARLRELFEDVSDGANSIARVRWVETSEDFRDEDMGTIMRYCRIRVLERK